MTLPLLKLWIDTKESSLDHKSTGIFIALDCEMLRLPMQRVATTIELFFKLVLICLVSTPFCRTRSKNSMLLKIFELWAMKAKEI